MQAKNKKPTEPEDWKARENRLQSVCGALELALGGEWNYFLIIGKPGDAQSVNVLSNTDPRQFKKLIDEVLRRWDDGAHPQRLDL